MTVSGGLHRDAICQHRGAAGGLKGDLGLRQFRAGVDAQRLCLGAEDGGGRQPIGHRKTGQVGQVVFTGGIVVADLCQKPQHRGRITRHQAGIEDGDGALGLGRILGLDDAQKLVAIHDEPPIAAGIGGVEPQHDDIVMRARGLHRGKGFL